MTTKSLFLSVLTVLGSTSMASAAIVITNGSFEANNIGDGVALAGATTGWTGGTPYLVDNNTTQNKWFNQSVPEGQQAASLGGSYFGQQLNDGASAVLTTAVSQQFQFSFFAGRRKENNGTGSFTVLLQAFNGNTYLGDIVSQKYFTGTDDSDAATIDLGLGVGMWSNQILLNLIVPGNVSFGLSRNIRLVFAESGTYGGGTGSHEVAIDNVTAIPEPSTYGLLGAGALAGVAFVRRRRRR